MAKRKRAEAAQGQYRDEASEAERRYSAAMARLLTERRSRCVELTAQWRALGKESP